MIKEETWSISIQRACDFFREQQDVTQESIHVFSFRSCRIQLTELTPRAMGIWTSRRIRIRMEGEAADVETIYHRYFIQFLSAGG